MMASSVERSSVGAAGSTGDASPTAASASSPSDEAIAAAQHQYTAEYLAQLLKDKKQLGAFPSIFVHLDRLVDDEINKVRVSLFQFEFNKDSLDLPEATGNVTTVQEKVFVPAKEYPDYNFVGRILGPRGMTAKQLEQETGCKIMVRGRGSMRDKKKEEMNRGKPNWEHLNDELHVLVQCEDAENRAHVKLQRAVDEIRKLLVPAAEGEDELKRKQLMELAIINGTYRPANQSKIALRSSACSRRASRRRRSETPRLLTPMSLSSPMRSPTLAGAPIILSPTRAPAMAAMPSVSSHCGGAAMMPGSPSSAADFAAANALFINSTFDPSLASVYPYAAAAAAAALSSPFASPFASPFCAMPDYPPSGAIMDMSHVGAILNQRKLLGQARDHPYQRGSLKPSSS